MRKRASFLSILLGLAVVLTLAMGLYLFMPQNASQSQEASQTNQTTEANQETNQSSEQKSSLPEVSSQDWELLLVNRDNITAELNPDLAEVADISVDSRIAQQVTDFLAAAQAIDASYHLISGYRSVAYQEEVYNGYLAQEMAADPSLTEEAAAQQVQTYSQPAGASEHQTGLAIDISTVDSLNANDPDLVSQLVAIAPDYGFVLRFPEGKTDVTGIGYEDWHFRYVGVESAKYMSQNQLTLEEYLDQVKEAE